MKDYFSDIKEYVRNRYNLTVKKDVRAQIDIDGVLVSLGLEESTEYIYKHYKAFEIVWHDSNNRYMGCINFVSAICIENKHKELVEIMHECYDVELDELDIVEDIIHWYPVFCFPNGDAFCLDIRNNTIVFYEHEIYDGEKNLHGLLIANSLNELFEKWSCFHFVDVYDWSEVVNADGIDLNNSLITKYM